MITFSLNRVYNTLLCVEVLGVMDGLTPFFRYHFYSEVDNIKHKVFETVMRNYDSNKGDLKRYVMATTKKMRMHKAKEIAVDNNDMENPYYNLEDLQSQNRIIGTGMIDTMRMMQPDMEQVKIALRDIYLIDPEAFELLYRVLVSAEAFQKGVQICNAEIKSLFLECVRDVGTDNIIAAMQAVHTEIEYETRRKDLTNSAVYDLKVRKEGKAFRNRLRMSGAIETLRGEPVVMDSDTLLLSYPVDSRGWRKIACDAGHMYKLDYSSIVDELYMKVFNQDKYDNEYVSRCGNRYKCFTLSGSSFLNIEQNDYFDKVRAELVNVLVKPINCTIVGCTPDNVYFITTKNLEYDFIGYEDYMGKRYLCELQYID